MADYETLTLEREIACAPERLFHVMTDRDLRQKWSAPNDESVVIIDYFDCRPGGREEARCGPKDAPEFNTIGHSGGVWLITSTITVSMFFQIVDISTRVMPSNPVANQQAKTSPKPLLMTARPI